MANFNLPRDDPSGLATCTGAQGVYSIDTVTDLGNCGKCGNSCATNAGSICVFGTCVPSTSSSPVPTTTPINSLTTSITTPQTTLPTSSQSPSPPFSRSSTASSSSSSNSPTIPPHSKNISSGTAVGIGFGSAIAGALLAGLVIFFLLARRSRRQPIYQQQDSPREIGGYTTQEKPGITTTVTNVDRLLPQPTEDDTLINELSKIRDGIKNHVQNYYHTAPVDPKMVDEARLVELARILAIPTSTVVDLLLNPATRIPSLRLFLAHLILSRCTGQSDVTQSFLPGEVSAFVGSDITAQSSPGKSDFPNAHKIILMIEF
ncbi:hypothetical protein N431DRAFT_121172 [Stipitochalara longipes BDJ]|nr:hypothetical protein N431DRAFT_121172 [Stipitochalara longipes BDJ]